MGAATQPGAGDGARTLSSALSPNVWAISVSWMLPPATSTISGATLSLLCRGRHGTGSDRSGRGRWCRLALRYY
jgi:hypothetical protein